jgi:GNAT superfamily N-acetyltransferase
MPNLNLDLEIRPLDKQHDLGAFSCGEPRIDNYLKHTAWKEHKAHKIRVFAATKPGQNRVCGYYSLTFIVWQAEAAAENVAKKFEKNGSVPAIYLAKLGVEQSESGQGIGTKLMRDAFEKCLAISHYAGIPTLTLQAINEEKAKWYEYIGLERFQPRSLDMVIALSTLRKALQTK